MESYGELLKKARIAKNLDIETVERDTSITRRYLEALEAEDADVFPGEPYLFGFLHNYAEYLGLDSKSIVALYKNKKLQESPIPVELYKKERSPLIVPLIVFGCVVFVAAVVTLLYVFVFSKFTKPVEDDVALGKNAQIHQYTLTDQPFMERLYKRDQLIIPDASGNIVVTVASTLGTLALDMPAGRQIIELSEESEIDVNGDSKPEMIVYVSDLSSSVEDRGAEVKIMLVNPAALEKLVTEEVDAAQPEQVSSAGNTVIFSDNRAYPFTINITFRGSCEFRSMVDRGETTENYYASGEIISMTPQNAARLWMSNSNAVKIQVIANGQTYNLDIGKAGQVVVEDIKWIKDTDGMYKVVVVNVD